MAHAMPSRADEKRDLAPIGRPGGRGRAVRFIREAGQRLSGEVERPDGSGGPAPALLAAIRGEGDARAIRRPRGRAVVPIAIGELPWSRMLLVRRDDEEMRAQFVDIADAVHLVREPVNRAHTRQVASLQRRVVHLWIVGLARLRAEGDSFAIRRPDRLARAIAQPGKLARLAAIHWNHPDLRSADTTLALRRVRSA